MIKKISILFLFVIPAITLVTSRQIIRERQNDWYGSGYDPSYAYLYNSLNIATFKLVGHIDHPGTTTQVFGGIILKIAWLIDDQGESTLKDSVLKHPEYYLNVLKHSTAIFCSLMLLLFGWIIFVYTSNIWYSLLIQLAPFISGVVLFNSPLRFSQESMFMIASIAMGSLAVIWYFGDNKNNKSLINLFGLVSGFGLASKIIFIPLMLIPVFCLFQRKSLYRYLAITFLSFIILTLPIIRLYPNMAYWFINLFVHSGIYGSGASTVIDTSSYISNLKTLVVSEPVLLGIYISNLIVIMVLFIRRLFTGSGSNKKALIVLFSIFLVQSAGYIITAKHPKVAYLLPYDCISVVIMIVITDLVTQQFSKGLIKNIVSGIIVITFAVFVIDYGLNARKQLYQTLSNPVYENAWKISTQKKAVVGVNPGPSPIAAMFFGNAYSRNRYNSDLMKYYPDFYIFDSYTNKLIDWNRREISFQELREKYANSIAIIGSDVDQTIKEISFDGTSGFEKIDNEKVQVAIVKE